MATLTDREYDAELHKLHDQLLLMGAKVEEMIANSMRSLTEPPLAEPSAFLYESPHVETWREIWSNRSCAAGITDSRCWWKSVGKRRKRGCSI